MMVGCAVSGSDVGWYYQSMSTIGVLFQLHRSYIQFFANYFCYVFIITLLPLACFMTIALLFNWGCNI